MNVGHAETGDRFHLLRSFFFIFVTLCCVDAAQATALAAELEALLAEDCSEDSTPQPPVVAGLESKPEEQAKSSDACQPELAKQILDSEEGAEEGHAAEKSQDAEARA